MKSGYQPYARGQKQQQQHRTTAFDFFLNPLDCIDARRNFSATQHSRPTHYNSAQAARPARTTKPPAATWPASDFLDAVGEVAPVAEPVPEALLEEVDAAPLELELELEPLLEEDDIWWRRWC